MTTSGRRRASCLPGLPRCPLPSRATRRRELVRLSVASGSPACRPWGGQVRRRSVYSGLPKVLGVEHMSGGGTAPNRCLGIRRGVTDGAARLQLTHAAESDRRHRAPARRRLVDRRQPCDRLNVATTAAWGISVPSGRPCKDSRRLGSVGRRLNCWSFSECSPSPPLWPQQGSFVGSELLAPPITAATELSSAA